MYTLHTCVTCVIYIYTYFFVCRAWFHHMPFQKYRLFVLPSIITLFYIIASICVLRVDPYICVLLFSIFLSVTASVKEHQESIYTSPHGTTLVTTPVTASITTTITPNYHTAHSSPATLSSPHAPLPSPSPSALTPQLYYTYNYSYRDLCTWVMLLVVMNFHWLMWGESERLNVQFWGIYVSLIIIVSWSVVRPVVPLG